MEASTFAVLRDPSLRKSDQIKTVLVTMPFNSGSPFKSPTMAGGLFAIDRTFFDDLGGYDPGLNVWGGENLELSFKVHNQVKVQSLKF